MRRDSSAGDKRTGVTATYGIDWTLAETSEHFTKGMTGLVTDMLLDKTSRTEDKQRIAAVSTLPVETVKEYGDEAYLYMLGLCLSAMAYDLMALTRTGEIAEHAEEALAARENS